MRLNPECIRDIMFYLEEHLSFSDELEPIGISIYEIDENLSYSIQEITNTVLALGEAKFIDIAKLSFNNRINELTVLRITFSGYQFIESVRPASIWEKVKSVGYKAGSMSISVIMQIATSVLTSKVNSLLTGV